MPDDTNKQIKLTIAMTPTQHTRWKEAADQMGIKLPEWVRRAGDATARQEERERVQLEVARGQAS